MGWLLLRLPQHTQHALIRCSCPPSPAHPRPQPLTVAPSPVTAARCCAVKGESHMNVFIAGASSSGLLKSHALRSRRGAQGWRGVSRSPVGSSGGGMTHHGCSPTGARAPPLFLAPQNPKPASKLHLTTQVTKLSHKPLATLASVLAAAGGEGQCTHQAVSWATVAGDGQGGTAGRWAEQASGLAGPSQRAGQPIKCAGAQPPPESGAMTNASAQRRSSMCTTGSPTARHCRHSSSSPAQHGAERRRAGCMPIPKQQRIMKGAQSQRAAAMLGWAA